MNENQILAIWGNPSSGKTTTSIKIAKELSEREKNVIVVFCDVLCPTAMTILPHIGLENKSLGRLLSAPSITQADILSECITLEKNEYLSFLGYAQGENIFTYAEYSKERAMDLLILLRHLADYVILDCSSNFTSDILSTVALEMADKVIRLKSVNLKAISYFDSYLPLLADRRFNVERHVKVISNTKDNEPKEQIKEKYHGIKYELPHVEEITEQFLSGELLGDLKSKEKEEHNRALKELIALVFDEKVEDVKKEKSKVFSWLKGGKSR
ncbi:AAA family ATPase [Clostridium kluyveri]|uniref:AAA family ATPase n=1 Tax=Clostridium kluyveri TaxID=1534 RepID=UPI002247314B|nr:AAA family ATPase [Clostridium kluyveri]UZQ48861.1 AAA family ATPase [Clostridium kluyveri]